MIIESNTIYASHFHLGLSNKTFYKEIKNLTGNGKVLTKDLMEKAVTLKLLSIIFYQISIFYETIALQKLLKMFFI